MFRPDYTTAIIRLLYGWPPYIFLFNYRTVPSSLTP